MGPHTYLLRTEDTAITTGDRISHPITHSTHTHTHTLTYVFGNIYWKS